MLIRPRRLRVSEPMRKMVRETRLSPSSLICPLFVKEGKGVRNPIEQMQGQYHLSADTVCRHVEGLIQKGVHQFLLFGLSEQKDLYGSRAYDDDGVVQGAILELKKEFGSDILVIADVCMCDYTSHGHCGVVVDGLIDNDQTLPYLQKIALSYARSGADMVAPSDMMDGRVRAIRTALDESAYVNVGIMSYAVKYASHFYNPFRNAVQSAPQFGDRKQYQMDFHNKKEALKESTLDAQEGADCLIVKPALAYLDVIQSVSVQTQLPVAAYSVSGEYAMIKKAAQCGIADEYQLMCETAVAPFRAGASVLITYYAQELADAIKRGDIG